MESNINSTNSGPDSSKEGFQLSGTVSPGGSDELTQLKQQLAQYQQKDLQLKHYMQAPDTVSPEVFEEQVAQRASEIVSKQQSAQKLVNEYSKKYPDLVPFQDAIVNEALAAMVDAHHQGQFLDDRMAIETGVERFQAKLKGYIEKFNQLQNQDSYRKRLMKIDVGYGGQPTLPSIGHSLTVIGDDDAAFAQYRQAYLRSRNS